MFGLVDEEIASKLHAKDVEGTVLTIVLLVLATAMEAKMLLQLAAEERHLRSVLSLLLHVPPSTVSSSPRITKVLGGNFTSTAVTVGEFDQEFFDKVFQELPVPIVYAQAETLKVQGANEAFRKLFQVEEATGRSLREILSSDVVSGDMEGLYTEQKTVPASMRVDDVDVAFEITSIVHIHRLVLTFLDVTQATRYMSLIREERERSDELLRQVLPPSLVPRVAAGEADISFAVQSASVSFNDIVSFTPWCGKTPAARVMLVLNSLFAAYDREAKSRPTLMRTKCIGDCYVCAGGVFAEESQPTTHAREMVSFGLSAIGHLARLGGELGEALQCRVGVNTGGPLVAGVLGGSKPTFEILGPVITMAQEMEHLGVPGQVHITRAVYELIYGEHFEVKERGLVETKRGKTVTYLVTGTLGAAAQPRGPTCNASRQVGPVLAQGVEESGRSPGQRGRPPP
jgi:class 3 adenylate cyclase